MKHLKQFKANESIENVISDHLQELLNDDFFIRLSNGSNNVVLGLHPADINRFLTITIYKIYTIERFEQSSKVMDTLRNKLEKYGFKLSRFDISSGMDTKIGKETFGHNTYQYHII